MSSMLNSFLLKVSMASLVSLRNSVSSWDSSKSEEKVASSLWSKCQCVGFFCLHSYSKKSRVPAESWQSLSVLLKELDVSQTPDCWLVEQECCYRATQGQIIFREVIHVGMPRKKSGHLHTQKHVPVLAHVHAKKCAHTLTVCLWSILSFKAFLLSIAFCSDIITKPGTKGVKGKTIRI